MKYAVTGHAPTEDVATLAGWLFHELNTIAATLDNMELSYLLMEQLNEEPAKPAEGMLVYADGTNWNPGSGKGIYQFRASAWVSIG